MNLTAIQKKAVEEIIDCYSRNEKVIVEFKSPTGSGKTFVASHVISNLMERNLDQKFIVIIATPSSAKLPYFFENKLNKYKQYLPFSDFEVEYLESPYSKKNITDATPRIRLIPNKVYIFGKASFGKGRLFTERNIFGDFVNEAIENNFRIVYIRDEAHIGELNRIDSETRTFEYQMNEKADFIVKMTATPNYQDSNVNFVQIREIDLNDPIKNENHWLLKTTPIILINQNMSEEELVESAIQEFIQVKESYSRLEEVNVLIKPALLIQVSNEPTNEFDKRDFRSAINTLLDKLNYYNLSWVRYFGDNDKGSNLVYGSNFSLDEVTQNNSDVDVVVFKIGPSVGWDIPRACMLLQIRQVNSDTLNTQTIGRIKRNPFPKLSRNEITDKYYIYSNSPRIDEDINFFHYQVKSQYSNLKFPIVELVNNIDPVKGVMVSEIEREIIFYLENNKNNIIQELKKIFTYDDNQHVFRKKIYEVNGSLVYRPIINPFIFLKYLDNLIENNISIAKYIEVPLTQNFIKIFSNEVLYNDIPIKKEHVLYVLIKSHKSYITNIIKSNTQTKLSYKITFKNYEPDSFSEIYNKQIHFGNLNDPDNVYLFDILRNNESSNLQPLDSRISEPVVFNFLNQKINSLNNNGLDSKVEIWAKNNSNSNLNGQYLGEWNQFRKSYFDFIIKFRNNNFLYIEVKSENDINYNKTLLLKEAYNDYFVKKENNLFSANLFISLWTVRRDHTITHETFYESDNYEDNLNNYSIDQLIEHIAFM